MLMEIVLERIARAVDMDLRTVSHRSQHCGHVFCSFGALQVKEQNFLKDGDLCLNSNIIKESNLQRCWDECLQMFSYDKRRAEVEEYNRWVTFRPEDAPDPVWRSVQEPQMEETGHRDRAGHVWPGRKGQFGRAGTISRSDSIQTPSDPTLVYRVACWS